MGLTHAWRQFLYRVPTAYNDEFRVCMLEVCDQKIFLDMIRMVNEHIQHLRKKE